MLPSCGWAVRPVRPRRAGRTPREAVPDERDVVRAGLLDGKVAIVTGASSGLGARFARVLDAAGAGVALLARRLDRLRALAAELNHGLPLACDLSIAAEIDRAVDAAIEHFGRIDVLVNNAGVVDVVPTLDEPLEQFRGVLDVNLVAPFALAQRAAQAMVAGGNAGSIVNVASILGLVGVGQVPQAGYTASKGGIVNLTRELSAQWARQGIRVNAIAPGWFETEMTAEMFARQRGHDWVGRRTPMGRQGREGELDGALLFLASDASSYGTGQIVVVDGGWTAV